MANFCECCGKKLDDAKIVWLELDTRTDEYTSDAVPEEYSQGAFPFGAGCAKKADAAKRKPTATADN
jgi:hypothetical protein